MMLSGPDHMKINIGSSGSVLLKIKEMSDIYVSLILNQKRCFYSIWRIRLYCKCWMLNRVLFNGFFDYDTNQDSRGILSVFRRSMITHMQQTINVFSGVTYTQDEVFVHPDGDRVVCYISSQLSSSSSYF